MPIFRDYLISKGMFFSEAVQYIAEKMGVKAEIIPMCDEKVTFNVSTDQGDLSILEYRSKAAEGLISEVKRVEYVGMDKAVPNPRIEAVLSTCSNIIIGPSNPPLYIDPLLTFEEIKESIEKALCNVIAISPVLGDEPITKPLKRLMKEALDHGTSIMDIAQRYPGLIDTLIIDKSDEKHKEKLEEMGIEVLVTDVKLGTLEQRENLAEVVARIVRTKL